MKADLRHRNLHAMRRTFISLLLQNRESPAYVRKQVGHKSMDITVNVDGHFVAVSDVSVLAGISRKLNHTSPLT